jgi:hypothetical protein
MRPPDVAVAALNKRYSSLEAEKEDIMVSNDYLFAVLFMICVWLVLHSGHRHLMH